MCDSAQCPGKAEADPGLTFIEQLTARSLKPCPSQKAPILLGTHKKIKNAVFIRAACGLWSCPVCSTRNARKWIARLLEGMNHPDTGAMWYFVTITAHEKWRGDVASLKNIRANWQKLRKRMARAVDGPLYYAMVYEPHEDNSFHLHILTNAPLNERWYKDNARQSGMGYEADCSPMKNPGKVAGYVAKYMLKSAENAERYTKGMRRINVSQNWPELPELSKPGSDYDYIPVGNRAGAIELRDRYIRLGYNVADPQHIVDKFGKNK